MMTERKTAKTRIKEATTKLLGEKTYLDITVSDIVVSADIARVSFYRNYASIAEVFDDIVSDVLSEISQGILPVLKSNDEIMWRDLLQKMFDGFPKHHSIGFDKKSENNAMLFARMMEKIQSKEKCITTKDRYQQYIGFGKIGLIVNIIKKWMADNQRESAEEMVNFMMTFITAF